MTGRQRLLYGVLVALAVFFAGAVLGVGGALWVNAIFALAMGGFAVVAVTVAARMAGRGER